MVLSLAQSAIALLSELAERGEIDPWDVQVIEVIDRFLSELTPSDTVEISRATYQSDLSRSGQAFLYASMLVLLKADTLVRAESSEVEVLDEGEFLETDGFMEAQMPLHLERRLRRRAVAKPPQNRRVTLQELIEQLELMADTMKEAVPRTRPRRPRPQSRSQAVRAIAQLAHQENLSEVAAALERFLATQGLKISQGEDWLDFDLLLELWSGAGQQELNLPGLSHGSHHNTGDRVTIFWALLFLSAQSKVELSQEEFYQDLKVRSLTELPIFAVSE
ncbi:MAG: segregation/condensation protein A [Trichocoleus desertorum ATA4-8-CV12]|jgi:segregation and condensation protein A|nr:segregation/condensation protein A [Trichocoleus desertorum ATA4-8-CV12]